MQKTYGNEIGGAEMVAPKRRDPCPAAFDLCCIKDAK